MLESTACVRLFVFLALSASLAGAQAEIASIYFDSIPGGTDFVTGGQPIELQADTNVTGTLTATGEVVSGTGVRFPDGTVQVTAGSGGAGVTANASLYSNTIADFTPPNAYTEICVKAGGVLFDIHAAAEPTSGGNCSPGDTGWIIERFERNAGASFTWAQARMECLTSGMRLPELFEWQISCEDAALFALSDMEDDWEWSSNSSELIRQSLDHSSDRVFTTVPVIGSGSCLHATQGTHASNSGASPSTATIRCIR